MNSIRKEFDILIQPLLNEDEGCGCGCGIGIVIGAIATALLQWIF